MPPNWVPDNKMCRAPRILGCRFEHDNVLFFGILFQNCSKDRKKKKCIMESTGDPA